MTLPEPPVFADDDEHEGSVAARIPAELETLDELAAALWDLDRPGLPVA
jgi:hypothetical protein